MGVRLPRTECCLKQLAVGGELHLSVIAWEFQFQCPGKR